MRNVLKKAAAAALALSMCLSFAGCYSEDKKWAAKKGEDTMPIGGYIYFLNNAYSEAAAKIGTDTDVLKGTVEDKDASTWIKEKAMEGLKSYYYISDKFNELGLELTEEEKTSAQSLTSSMWSYYKATFEEMGVAESSFNQVYSLASQKQNKVMEKMYSEGGELAIPENDLKTYFTDNYYSYEYFYASLSKTGDDGSSVDLTDDEKTELKKTLEEFVTKINAGETTVSEAATDYAYTSTGSADSSTYSAPAPSKGSDLNETILNAISSLEDNKTTFAETTTGYYVIKKLPIADKFAEVNEDSTQKLSLISAMKGEEFTDYIKEHSKDIADLEINQKALDSVSLSLLVTDTNKKGTSSTSSTSSETSSASSEAASSAASSTASSDVSSSSK